MSYLRPVNVHGQAPCSAYQFSEENRAGSRREVREAGNTARLMVVVDRPKRTAFWQFLAVNSRNAATVFHAARDFDAIGINGPTVRADESSNSHSHLGRCVRCSNEVERVHAGIIA